MSTGVAAQGFTTCADYPHLMTEVSGRDVFDEISNMDGNGYSDAEACPPAMPSKELVVTGDIALYDSCTAPPCAEFHDQSVQPSGSHVRSGFVRLRDAQDDAAVAWHEVPFRWLIQTMHSATVLFYHPDYPSDPPVAVWDLSFGTDGRVDAINGNPINILTTYPLLRMGAGLLSYGMTEDTGGTLSRNEVVSRNLVEGGPTLEARLHLTQLFVARDTASTPCSDGDVERKCAPSLYGRYGTIPLGTIIQTRSGQTRDVGGEDIPAYDKMWGAQGCRFSFHRQTQRFEGAIEAHQQIAEQLGTKTVNGRSATPNFDESSVLAIRGAQLGVTSEWQRMMLWMHREYGLDMSDVDPDNNSIDGLPAPGAPTRCDEKPRDIMWPSYADYEQGLPDQIVLLLDRSGSMAQAADGWAVPNNRLDFVKAGARAYLDAHAQRSAPPKVSITYFNHEPTTSTLLSTLDATTLSTYKTDHLRDSSDSNPPQPVPPVPQGATNISAALHKAVETHESSSGTTSKSIVLLTDGEDTTLGNEAVEELMVELRKTYHLQSITTGFDGNDFAIAQATDLLNGWQLSTPDPVDLRGAFFEAAAREMGQPLARHYTTPPDGEIVYEVTFPYYSVYVEPGAEELRVLLPGARGANTVHPQYAAALTQAVTAGNNSTVQAAAIGLSSWDPLYLVVTPSNQVLHRADLNPVEDLHYRMFSVAQPEPGEWRILARDTQNVAVIVRNPEITCSISPSTSLVEEGGPVVFTLSASDGSTLGEGVDFDITVTGPDDTPHTLSATRSPTSGEYLAYLDPAEFSGRGKYLAVARCSVDADVKVVEGEKVSGPETTESYERSARAFVREASAAFYLKLDEPAHLPDDGPRGDDADMDGIPNDDEPSGDFDGDGRDDIYDGDADNDDVPDGIDPDPHDKNVPNPQSCNVQPTDVACCEALWSCGGAKQYALYAEGNLDVRDRARVETPQGEGAPIANAGTGSSMLGVDAVSGDIESLSNLSLRERARVKGHARTAGTISEQNAVVVDEGRLPNANIALPPLAGFNVVIPASSNNVTLAPHTSTTLAPGSYGTVNLGVGSQLFLGSGTYYFQAVNVVEPNAEIVVASVSNSPTRIYVKNSFIYRGKMRDLANKKDHLFIGYMGTQDAHIETPFVGTFVAPRAKVYLKPLNGLVHTGAFFGKHVELDANTTVHHVPFPFSWVGADVEVAGGPTGLALLSFEDAARPWTGSSGIGLSSVASHGASSLELTACGYQTVSSTAFNATELTGLGDRLDLDLYVPTQVENPYWIGSVDVQVKRGYQVTNLGNINLTPLPRGQWTTKSLPLTSGMIQQLSSPGMIQLQLVVNTSVCQNSVLVDHLRWGGAITLGERYVAEPVDKVRGCSVSSPGGGENNFAWWWLVGAVVPVLRRATHRAFGRR